MVFSSLLFLFYFLPAVLVVYFLVPRRFKNVVLLVFSLAFYGWGEPVYVLLMVFSILMVLLPLFSCFHGIVRSVCVSACMAGTFRMESIQLFAVLYGNLHAAPTIHPATEMPYVPFSVTDFRTKFTFISV